MANPFVIKPECNENGSVLYVVKDKVWCQRDHVSARFEAMP